MLCYNRSAERICLGGTTVQQAQQIATQERWDKVADSLASFPELAIDTESNSMHAYRSRICLIQIACSDASYLVDPLAVRDLSALGHILQDSSITKVMHGADYDMRCFYREYGFEVSGLFDTETCARFQGMLSPNLAAVIKAYLDVEIPTSRRLQRSDWALRPLSVEATAYAAADVQHLIALAAKLRRLLREAGRLEWVAEEFGKLEAAGQVTQEHTEPAYFRVKGCDRLDPQQMAVLKELFELREAEAERADVPPYRIMGNDVLLFLAREPHTALENAPGLSPSLARRSGSNIRSAIQKGLRGPGLKREPRPRRHQPPSKDVQVRLQGLKEWRTGKGAALALDPALIWPAISLERLAQDPKSWNEELGAAEVRSWQRREFAVELEEAFHGISV